MRSAQTPTLWRWCKHVSDLAKNHSVSGLGICNAAAASQLPAASKSQSRSLPSQTLLSGNTAPQLQHVCNGVHRNRGPGTPDCSCSACRAASNGNGSAPTAGPLPASRPLLTHLSGATSFFSPFAELQALTFSQHGMVPGTMGAGTLSGSLRTLSGTAAATAAADVAVPSTASDATSISGSIATGDEDSAVNASDDEDDGTADRFRFPKPHQRHQKPLEGSKLRDVKVQAQLLARQQSLHRLRVGKRGITRTFIKSAGELYGAQPTVSEQN